MFSVKRRYKLNLVVKCVFSDWKETFWKVAFTKYLRIGQNVGQFNSLDGRGSLESPREAKELQGLAESDQLDQFFYNMD